MRSLNEVELAAGLESGTIGLADEETVVNADAISAAMLDGAIVTLIVQNVVIRGELRLATRTVSRAIVLSHCKIELVDARYATFERLFHVQDCSVDKIVAQAANFSMELQIERSNLKLLNIGAASFGRGLIILNSQCEDFTAPAIKCGQDFIIRDCSFERSDLNSGNADACEWIGVSGEFFLARFFKASLIYARFSGEFFTLERAAIRDGLNVSESKIDRFDLTGAEVNDRVVIENSHFGSVQVAHAALGVTIIRGVVIREDTTIAATKFTALSCSAKFGGLFNVSDSRFAGPVHLLAVEINGDFLFQRCLVEGSIAIGHESPERPKFNGRFFMPGCRVETQFLLSGIDVAGVCDLEATTAGDLVIADSIFGADVRCSHARIMRNFQGYNTQIAGDLVAQSVNLGRADFRRVDVRGRIDMLSLTAEGVVGFIQCTSETLEIPYGTAKRALYLIRTVIRRKLDLAGAAIGELVFDLGLERASAGFMFPPVVVLRETAYQAFQAKWLYLVESLERQQLPEWTAFRELDAYFRKMGRYDWADEVRYRGRKAVTRTFRLGWQKAFQTLLDLVSGYGAKPMRLLVTAALVFGVLCGVVFKVERRGCVATATISCRSFIDATGDAVDFTLRGDQSNVTGKLKGVNTISSQASSAAPHWLDVAVSLRFVIFLLVGLWAGYLTGLIRYSGASN